MPWQARRVIARADAVQAYSLMEQYSGEDGAIMAEIDAMGNGPLAADVGEYTAAYNRWASGFGSNG